MTVASGLFRKEYVGNGVATSFSYDWKIYNATDIAVYLVDSGNDSQQTLTTDYTVSGVGSNNGGNVVFNTAPPSGVDIVIIPSVEIEQQTDFRNQGRFYPETHEYQFDHNVVMHKMWQEEFARSMKMNVGETHFDAKGKRIKNGVAPTEGTDYAIKSYVDSILGGGGGGGSSVFVTPMDYGAVGDGVVDDTQALQDACTAASADGFILLIPSKKSYRTTAPVNLPSDITIIGQGKESKILGRANTGARNGVFVANDKSNISIIGVHIDHNYEINSITLNGCNDVTVKDCYLTMGVGATYSASTIGIYESDTVSAACNSIKVQGNTIVCPSLAVLVQSGGGVYSDNIKITGNSVTNNLGVGDPTLYTTGVIKVDLYASNVFVTENYCDGNSKVEAFIQVEEAVKDVVISNNTIKDCTEHGIKLFDGQSGQLFSNINISDNTLNNCGIQVTHSGTPSSKAVVITGNSVLNSPVRGIDCPFIGSLEGVVISNNCVVDSASIGVHIRSSKSVISSNYISSQDLGVDMQSSPNSVISNNVIDTVDCCLKMVACQKSTISGNNMVSSASTQAGGCITYIGTLSGNDTVTGNVFDSSIGTAVFLDTSTQPISLGNNSFINGTPNEVAKCIGYGNLGADVSAIPVQRTSRSVNNTFTPNDANKEVVYTVGGLTGFIATEATQPLQIGDKLSLLSIAGTTTITANTGVLLNGINGGSCTLAQYENSVITKIASDSWVIVGGNSNVA